MRGEGLGGSVVTLVLRRPWLFFCGTSNHGSRFPPGNARGNCGLWRASRVVSLSNYYSVVLKRHHDEGNV